MSTLAEGDPERQLVEQLSRLEIGRGPLVVERISGGITNHNFVVRSGVPPQCYVARRCEPLPLLGIDRLNERVCQEAASAWGLAPEVVHHEDGLLITRFIEGRTLKTADLRDPAILPRVAALLRHLHDSWDLLVGDVLYFCPFQVVRTYGRTARRLGAEVPDDLEVMLEDARQLSHRIAPFRPVLCHNDLLPANLIDDGDRLWLIDWEYAGVGHPFFDVANVSANGAHEEELERSFISAYRQTPAADPRDLLELRIFKVVSLLRDVLWSTIQSVLSDIDFDFRRYAAESLEAYRASRSQLQSHL